jgi:hypothetical protein
MLLRERKKTSITIQSQSEGCLALFVSVILDAVEVMQRGAPLITRFLTTDDKRRLLDYVLTYAWFLAEDYEEGSFLWMLTNLGLDDRAEEIKNMLNCSESDLLRYREVFYRYIDDFPSIYILNEPKKELIEELLLEDDSLNEDEEDYDGFWKSKKLA